MFDSLQFHGLCPWGFSRQEYWSGLPCPPSGNLPKPGIESRSSALQVESLPFEPPETQEYWSGYPIPSAGALPNSGIKPASPALQADSLPVELPGKPRTSKYFGPFSTINFHKSSVMWWKSLMRGSTITSRKSGISI